MPDSIIDGTGTTGSTLLVNLDGSINITDYLIRTGLGLTPGQVMVNIRGENVSANSGTTVDTWDASDQSALINYPSMPIKFYVSSTKSTDTANSIFINGLDQDFNRQATIVGTTGSEQTLVTGSWRRFFSATNLSNAGGEMNGDLYIAGSNTLTAGVPDDTSLIYGKIIQGNEQTYHGTYTIPSGTTGQALQIFTNIGRGKEVNATTQIRFESGIWIVSDRQELFESMYNPVEFQTPTTGPEKFDLKIQMMPLNNNIKFFWRLGVLLTDNSLL